MKVEVVVSTEERLQILRAAQPNTWVAFSADDERVVARGVSFADAVKAAEQSGEKDPIFTLIPPTWGPTLL
jgi:hypothetical protein